MPDFVIIGGGKCGTTSLYNYLTEHPDIFRASWKEIHYFDTYMTGWYRSNFPTIFTKIKHKNFITGESSPYYLYHPLAAQRMAKMNPNAKLIIVLRDPGDRAYSHYNHTVRNGDEKLSFINALKEEPKRLEEPTKKLLEYDWFSSAKHRAFSYLGRGLYYKQITNWMKYYPSKQFYFIKSEDMAKQPQQILNKIYKFLVVPKYNNKDLRKFNRAAYMKMDSTAKEYLKEYYEIPNKELSDLLGNDFEYNYQGEILNDLP